MHSNKVIFIEFLNPSPITSQQVRQILVWILLCMCRVVYGFMTGILLIVKVMDLQIIWLVRLYCNQAVLFDCWWKNSIPFVVNVLSDDVYSSRGSCNKVRLFLVYLCEFLYQRRISRLGVLGVESLDRWKRDLWKHKRLKLSILDISPFLIY